MSKSKNNNNKGNKGGKVPLKVQAMKPQAAIVKKNVKEIKPSQVVEKSFLNKGAKVEIKKPTDKKNNQPKKLEKAKVITDILESCDDEDESDIDFDEMEDSDIDDVDINDSDDVDDDDEDEEDDDDEDLSVEDIDNSDYESVELDDEKLNEEGEESSEESEDEDVAVKQPIKKIKAEEAKKVDIKKIEIKKAEVKESKKVETKKPEAKKVEIKKPELKDDKKVEPIKVENKKVETKSEEKKVVLDNNSEDGKLLIEINNRKNSLCDSSVFITQISKFTRDTLNQLVSTVAPVVQINLPAKVKNKIFIPRGYGFVRMVNPTDALKCVDILNKNNVKASVFVCKKVINDINKVSRNRIVAHSFKYEDITDVLTKEFKAPIKVRKNLINQYVLEFPTNEAALTVFNKKSINVAGHKIVFNYYVGSFKDKDENKVSPVKKVAVEKKADDKVVTPVVKVDAKVVIKPEIKVVEPVKVDFEAAPVVKAGIKRAMVSSSEEEDDDEECEVVVKKFKQVNGEEKKVTPKKSQVSSPEVKKQTPKSENKVNKTKLPVKKGNDNKSPAEKKQFNKSPGDKKPFNKSPGDKKPFNKSPGDKKPFNKSPGDKKPFNKSPGDKKPFDKKSPAGNKQQFKNKSPANRKSFNKKF